MKIEIKFDDKQHVQIRMKEAPDTITESLHETTVAVVNDVRNEIIVRMERTQKAPWSYKRTKSGKVHHPSLPGFPPAKDSGDYVASIQPDDRWPDVEVGSLITDPPYPEYLERGTTAGFGSPFKGMNTGMAARPVWEPTIDDMHDQIENDLMEAIKRGI